MDIEKKEKEARRRERERVCVWGGGGGGYYTLCEMVSHSLCSWFELSKKKLEEINDPKNTSLSCSLFTSFLFSLFPSSNL